jgi:CspA family cold shock protein
MGKRSMRKAMFRTFSVLLTIAVLATPALAGRTTGVVKWYNAEKKMGFLQSASGDEIFVAASALSASCNGTLREGQSVEFEILVVKQGTPAVEKRTAKDVTCR